MRIISLNTWGGRAGKDKLLGFFKKHAETTDIFCLQEMWSHPHKGLEGRNLGATYGALEYSNIMTNGVRELSELLPDFVPFFRPHIADNYGLLMCIHRKYKVIKEGDIFVYKEKGYISEKALGDHARNIQYATIESMTGPITIINFHGLWNGKGKTDTEDRIQQSKNILESTKRLKGEYIICGDFNLLPDTESIKLFENEGLRNLIKEYKIASTRTSFYTKAEKFADYAFITKGIKLKEFKVLPDEVSDHAPLLIEVE